jgi:hypothetical protein
MKHSNKKSPNSLSFLIYTPIILGLILNSCTVVKNLCRKPEPVISRRPAAPPLSDSLEHLFITARISIQTDIGDATLSADIEYSSIDTVTITFRDPLRRQLANLYIRNREYELQLSRTERHYWGTELPTKIASLPLPAIPIQDISRLLIGQTDQLSENNHISILQRNETNQPTQIAIGEDGIFTVYFSDWAIAERQYHYPKKIKIATSDGISIIIQYSQFQLELRKLS